VGESIPVLEGDKEILGVVTEGDLLNIYLKVSKEEKDHENED
jgi:CBS domain-containing protein